MCLSHFGEVEWHGHNIPKRHAVSSAVSMAFVGSPLESQAHLGFQVSQELSAVSTGITENEQKCRPEIGSRLFTLTI